VSAVIWALAWPPFWALAWAQVMLWLGSPQDRVRLTGVIWAFIALAIGLVDCAATFWLAAACAGLNVAIGAAVWWWRRKKRRSVTALLGAKAKALRDALVRRAREATPKPRRVLRPVPGGAR